MSLTPEQKIRSSADIRAQIETLPRHQRLMRLNIHALRERVANLRAHVLTHCLQSHGELNLAAGSDTNHVDARAIVFSTEMTNRNLFEPLAASEAVLRVLENDQQHQTACEKIQPLIDELLAAEERESAELALAGQASHELREAKDKARAEFEANIDQQPQVQKAISKFESYLRRGVLVSE